MSNSTIVFGIWYLITAIIFLPIFLNWIEK